MGATLAVIARSHRTRRVTAAGAMPWLGSIRLLVASEQPSLLCLGMDDEWVTQYVTTHVGLRQAAAAADRVAAVNADRQPHSALAQLGRPQGTGGNSRRRAGPPSRRGH